MKKLLVLLVILLASNSLRSQFKKDPIINIPNIDKPLINFGFHLGLNQYDFQFEYENDINQDILVNKSFGFNVGLITEMRINKFVDLRFEPGLLFTQRDLGFPEFTTINDAIREVQSTYIRFPLLLKISTKRLNNFKPFLIGGGYTAINLSANEDSLDDNSSGTFRTKKKVYGYELGFGIDFYTEFFKFTPSLRGVFALTNELIPDEDPNSPWTGNINALRTRGVFISFTFESGL